MEEITSVLFEDNFQSIPLTGQIILLIIHFTNMEKMDIAFDQTCNIGNLKFMEVL